MTDGCLCVEILRTGSEGCLSIGIVPDGYPEDTTPGNAEDSVALITDQKGWETNNYNLCWELVWFF